MCILPPITEQRAYTLIISKSIRGAPLDPACLYWEQANYATCVSAECYVRIFPSNTCACSSGDSPAALLSIIGSRAAPVPVIKRQRLNGLSGPSWPVIWVSCPANSSSSAAVPAGNILSLPHRCSSVQRPNQLHGRCFTRSAVSSCFSIGNPVDINPWSRTQPTRIPDDHFLSPRIVPLQTSLSATPSVGPHSAFVGYGNSLDTP